MNIEYTEKYTQKQVGDHWASLIIGGQVGTVFEMVKYDEDDKALFPNLMDGEPIVPHCVVIKIGEAYITDVCCPTWETIANAFNAVNSGKDRCFLEGISYDKNAKVLKLHC